MNDYDTQERCYLMSRDVSDHGMPFDPPGTVSFSVTTDRTGKVIAASFPRNVHGMPPDQDQCSCGNLKAVGRTYCLPCTEAIDDGCALGQ